MSFITYSATLSVYDPKAKWAMAEDDPNQIVEWRQASKPKPTKAQLDALKPPMEKEYAMKLLREERDKKLAECDWRMTVDYINPDQELWTIYREELRQVPNRVESGTYSIGLSEDGELIFNDWPTSP